MVTETNMRIVVLIPTLNEEEHIADVIEQLRDKGASDHAWEVVVADGGSSDRTTEIVEGICKDTSNVSLLPNPGKTQAAAMNLMLDYGLGADDILIRADAHASYPADFVDALVESLKTHEAASVVIPMDATETKGCFQRGNAWIADSKLGAGGSPHRGGVVSGYVDHGHHAAFRMSSFSQLGGYDTTFIANEDAEFDRRLKNAGHQIWLDSSIRIEYYPRSTPGSLWRQYFRYGRGRAQTCLKHSVVPKPRQLAPVFHVLLLALSLIILPFSGLGLLWPTVYLLVIIAAGVASALSHKSLCGLAGGLAIGIMHLSWGLGFLVTLVNRGQSKPIKTVVPQ